MDAMGAIEASLRLAVRERMDAEGAFSYDHLMDMKRRIDAAVPAMSYGKLCRWLAWMQAALYHSGLASLDDLKNLSRGFVADEAPAGPPTVAVAGSIRFASRMEVVREALALRGIACEIPQPSYDELGDPAGWRGRLARRFMDIIAAGPVRALLLANFDQNDVKGYVGPSAFAEAAVAFSRGKPIYLLGDLPQGAFADELASFGAVPLKWDLAPLLDRVAPIMD